MNPAALVRLALTASILLLVFALGLRSTVADATYVIRRPRLILRGFLAMAVVVPVVAAALATLFDLRTPVRIALLALVVGPVPPLLPAKQLGRGARAQYVHGLLVAAALASIVVVPAAVEVLGWLFGREAHAPLALVARIVGTTVLLPLLAGLAVRRLAPGLAERVAPWATRAGNVLLLAGLAVVLIVTWRDVLVLIGNGTVLAMAGVVLAGLAAGHWLGGPDPADRTALALASSMRHPGLALAIARLNFPEETLVPAAVLLFILVNVILTLPYGIWRRRVAGGGAEQASSEKRT
jgi:BASS family bile acid:Na+ symporter